MPVNRQILNELLAKQTESGGFVTHYDEEGKFRGDTNVETTSLALMALIAIAELER
jgi:hypothetical protein